MITLFTNDCPKCKMLKELLDNKEVKYTICDDVELMKTLGFKTVPMLDVHGELVGFSEALRYIDKM